jgi:DNA-binding transcriptional ArsR family regulator
MQAKREYRDRDDTEVAVLDALVDRTEEGMTVLELRSGVGVDIDELERALSELKSAGFITVEKGEGPMRIYPAERVVPDEDAGTDGGSFLGGIREKLGL